MKKDNKPVVLDCTFSRDYTLEEIKKAFWGTFHEVGEIFFSYILTKEENDEYTNEWWETFLEELTPPKSGE